MIVAVIPARAGSKRLLGKNKRIFLGKPLICWSIDVALKIEFFDKIVVSTNDTDVLGIVFDYPKNKKLTYQFRPDSISTDDTPMWKVIKRLYLYDEIDDESIIVLLQPTSPLRLKEDIENGIKLFLYSKNGIVSVFKKNDLEYKRNGAFFIGYYKDWIRKGTVDGLAYLMPKERSVDIDTIEDFKLAEKIMRERMK